MSDPTGDPSLALQGALVAALKAAAITTVGGRVYDDVPPGAAFPYIVVDDNQVLGDDNECGDASEVIQRVHAYSRAVGFPEVKAITAAIRATLKAVPALTGFSVSLVEFVQARHYRDPDGKTLHGVVELRYLISHS